MKKSLYALSACLLMAGAARAETVVNIHAAPAKDYGADAVATFVSDTQKAGQATFQISIDVDPMAGGSVRSLGNGIWGIDSNESRGQRFTFDGNIGEAGQFVDGIGNIKVINFEANGSSLTAADIKNLSFKSVEIVDGEHLGDKVKIVAGGVANDEAGLRMSASPEDVDLQSLAGSSSVTSFTVACSNVSESNRWAIKGIQVAYTVEP